MTSIQKIEIRRLKVTCHIGVPDEERASPQELLVSLKMTVVSPFGGMEDDLSRTLDYAAAAEEIQELAASRPRRLIETLAADIAERAIGWPVVCGVDVTVEKFILPDTECVAVHLSLVREAL